MEKIRDFTYDTNPVNRNESDRVDPISPDRLAPLSLYS
jgi:hypothetical protein